MTKETIMEKYKVKPGQKVKLKDWDPDDKSLWNDGKKAAKEKFLEINQELEKLQEILYAENKHKILILLQAMDTGGKDGVIRAVFDGVNPSGVRVASFKVPTPKELSHDYLWRIHQQTPGRGELINNFEKLLADEGTVILKFFLNISKEEQKQRLQERLDIPEKNWKFSSGDLKERALWDSYIEAYEDVLSKTSTDYAPWYVIPSNRNWYRNYVIGSIIVDTLKSLKMNFPPAEEGLDKITIE